MELFEFKEEHKKDKYALPRTLDAWLKEIARVYCDALETIPFVEFVKAELDEANLFHLAPALCLKSRGLRRTKDRLKNVTEAALSSYVASCEDGDREAMKNPRVSFTLCYVASHFALDLISEENGASVLEFVEQNKREFDRMVLEHTKARETEWNNPENREAFYQKTLEWEKRSWKSWLFQNLTFPFKVTRKEDEFDPCFADTGRHELFRLGHTFEVLGIRSYPTITR